MSLRIKKMQSAPDRVRTHATFSGLTVRNTIDLVLILGPPQNSHYGLLPSMTLTNTTFFPKI